MFWLVLFGLIGLFIAGNVVEKNSYRFGFEGMVLGVIAAAALLMWLSFWPICYCDTVGHIQSFRATQATLDVSRNVDLDPLERATIQQKVIEENQWLASTQYWNTVFDPMFPDEVMELEPLK